MIWLSSGFSSTSLITIVVLTILDPKLDRNDADNQNGGNKVHVVPGLSEVAEPGMIHLSQLVGEEVYTEEVEDCAEDLIRRPE